MDDTVRKAQKAPSRGSTTTPQQAPMVMPAKRSRDENVARDDSARRNDAHRRGKQERKTEDSGSITDQKDSEDEDEDPDIEEIEIDDSEDDDETHRHPQAKRPKVKALMQTLAAPDERFLHGDQRFSVSLLDSVRAPVELVQRVLATPDKQRLILGLAPDADCISFMQDPSNTLLRLPDISCLDDHLSSSALAQFLSKKEVDNTSNILHLLHKAVDSIFRPGDNVPPKLHVFNSEALPVSFDVSVNPIHPSIQGLETGDLVLSFSSMKAKKHSLKVQKYCVLVVSGPSLLRSPFPGWCENVVSIPLSYKPECDLVQKGSGSMAIPDSSFVLHLLYSASALLQICRLPVLTDSVDDDSKIGAGLVGHVYRLHDRASSRLRVGSQPQECVVSQAAQAGLPFKFVPLRVPSDSVSGGICAKIFHSPPHTIFSTDLVKEAFVLWTLADIEEVPRFRGLYRHADESIGVVLDMIDQSKGFTLEELMQGSRPRKSHASFFTCPNGEDRFLHLLDLLLRFVCRLHTRGICHGDLSPHNIFLVGDAAWPCRCCVESLRRGKSSGMLQHATAGPDGHFDIKIKVIDFSSSFYFEQGCRRNIWTGSNENAHAHYQDPLSNESCLRPQADLFSLGILLWEVLHRRHPMPGNQTEIKSKLQRGERPDLAYLSEAPHLKTLLKKCWHQNPSQRWHSSGDAFAFVQRKKHWLRSELKEVLLKVAQHSR